MAPVAAAKEPASITQPVLLSKPAAPSTPSFSVLTGFADLETPAAGSNQLGTHFAAGMRRRAWCTVLFDFSQFSGSSQVHTGALLPAQQAMVLGAIAQYQAAGLLPAGYQYRIQAHEHTSTYGLGPQWNSGGLGLPFGREQARLFGSPALGALRESAKFQGTDPFSTAVLARAIPSGHEVSWAPFYGGSGGLDLPVGSRFWLRSEFDFVHSHPFKDTMANGSWGYRYSSGILIDFNGPSGLKARAR